MSVNEANLEKLKAKVEKLINLHKGLAEEYRHLELANGKLSGKLEEQKTKIIELESQNKTLKIAQAVTRTEGGDQNTRDLKLKINEYIREIDRCLAFMHQ